METYVGDIVDFSWPDPVIHHRQVDTAKIMCVDESCRQQIYHSVSGAYQSEYTLEENFSCPACKADYRIDREGDLFGRPYKAEEVEDDDE